MFGTALSLTSQTGIAHPTLCLTPQRVLEVAALTPQAPQTGVVLLDMALELSLATQAGLLIALPVCFQLSHLALSTWAQASGLGVSLRGQLQQGAQIAIAAYDTVLPSLGLQNQSITSTTERGLRFLESVDV